MLRRLKVVLILLTMHFATFPFAHGRTDNCTFKLAACFLLISRRWTQHNTTMDISFQFFFPFFFRLFGILDFSISITDTNTQRARVQLVLPSFSISGSNKMSLVILCVTEAKDCVVFDQEKFQEN